MMLIHLDDAIQLVPCGVPGDLDALSGRAHICSDRMRLAVTECKPPGEDCGLCPPGETPRFLYATVADIRACAPCVEVSGFHSVQTIGVEAVNGGEYELEQWLDDPHGQGGPCHWQACLPIGFRRRFYHDRYCQDFSHETVFRSIRIWAYLVGGYKRIEINASVEDDCTPTILGLFRNALPHDGNCLEWPVFTNDLVCGTTYLTIGDGSVRIRV